MTLPTLGTQLAVHLLRYYSAVRFREPAGKAGLSREQARRVAEYIDNRLHELLSLPSLAAVVELGVWGFGRRFRESFGRPPHGYVIERHVERAQRLLTEGGLPLKEVGCACRFADRAHITHASQPSGHHAGGLTAQSSGLISGGSQPAPLTERLLARDRSRAGRFPSRLAYAGRLKFGSRLAPSERPRPSGRAPDSTPQ